MVAVTIGGTWEAAATQPTPEHYPAPYLAGVLGVPEHPRNLAGQLTLFKPGWADFAPHTTASPPGFKKLSTPLIQYCLTSEAEQEPSFQCNLAKNDSKRSVLLIILFLFFRNIEA